MEKRVMMEFKRINQSPIQGITVQKTQDPSKWNVIIDGPLGSYYEGGRFNLEVIFPNQYPFKMALFKLNTRIWHPNVSGQGDICECHTIDGYGWDPRKETISVLLKLQDFLLNPKIEHICEITNYEAKTQFLQNKDEFKDKAQQYIQSYAKQ